MKVDFEVLSKRENLVWSLRSRGLTFKDIAMAISASTERARQIYVKSVRKIKRENRWYFGLPPQIVNCLCSAGYDTFFRVVKGLEKGTIIPGKNPRGFSHKSMKVLKEWVIIKKELNAKTKS